MGWQSDDSAHEGYFVGLIESEPGSGLFREINYLSERGRGDLHEHAPIPLQYVCVGCDCGWRSPRLFAPRGTDWTPYTVWIAHGQPDEIAEGYEESGRKLWQAHVEEIRKNGAPRLHIDQDGYRWAVQRREARAAKEAK